MFWGRLDENSGVHGNRNPPLTNIEENGVCTFSRLLLIWVFVFILADNEDMHKISDEFEFWPDRTTDYGVRCLWASKKISHRLIMGKLCLHASSFIFYQNISKVAGSQDRHKSSHKFDFRPDQTTVFGAICPWMMTHIQTWMSLKPVGQSWSNFMSSITGGGERLHNFWGRLDQNSGVHGNRNPPLTYNEENGVSTGCSTGSRLLLIRSFLYLQITRTCIKSRRSLNFGQIGRLTMELAALEHLENFPYSYNGKIVSPC